MDVLANLWRRSDEQERPSARLPRPGSRVPLGCRTPPRARCRSVMGGRLRTMRVPLSFRKLSRDGLPIGERKTETESHGASQRGNPEREPRAASHIGALGNSESRGAPSRQRNPRRNGSAPGARRRERGMAARHAREARTWDPEWNLPGIGRAVRIRGRSGRRGSANGRTRESDAHQSGRIRRSRNAQRREAAP